MRPPTASPARTALPAAHFDRNERHAYFGDRTLEEGNGRMEEWKEEGPNQSFDDLYRPGGLRSWLRSLAAALCDESPACGRLGDLGPTVARFALPIFHSSTLPLFPMKSFF